MTFQLTVLPAFLILLACAPVPGAQPAPPISPAPATATPPAQAPAPVKRGASFFRRECFEVYIGCPVTARLPAVSGDGTKVAVAYTGPDSPRDELLLTIRFIAIAGGAVVTELPIVTDGDHERGADADTGKFTAEVLRDIEARIRAVDRTLAQGGYEPLIALGVTHEQRVADWAPGLRAVFDGTVLRIIDTGGEQILWQRPVGPSAPFQRGDGHTCGPFPVADIHVWISRAPPTAVARVAYIGSDVCATELPYLVWR